MSGKVVLCRCEDVTQADVAHAVAQGYADLEEVKRYTGFGTGPCQGKECHALVAGALHRLTGRVSSPFTARPPLVPTALAALAQAPDAHVFEDGAPRLRDATVEHPSGDTPSPSSQPSPARLDAQPSPSTSTAEARPPLPERAEMVIVGAGVMGLSIAYQLARRGLTDVLVVDRGYLAGGASGRNGGGVRAQWSSELNVRLMQRSIELCRDFAVELGVNVWFRQGGYLFLARSDAEAARFERNAALHRRLGVRTDIIDAAAAQAIVPELDVAGIRAAAYNPDDGIVFPWPFMWGYARRAAALGVRIETHTAVHGLSTGARGLTVHTARGDVHARRVINACGAGSPELAAHLGVHVPTWPVRHEICSSEPLKPFLGPMVSEPSTGLYFSQSMRGEVVGGITLPHHGADASAGSTLRFLATYARRLGVVAPQLARLKVLRQWAGSYDESPDGSPVLGASSTAPDLYLCGGFVGRGFMMAPVVGELYAAWLTGEAPHEIFRRWHVDRFAAGTPARDEDFDIG